MIEESLINEIVEWNIKALPNNTLEMQLKKIDEENEEYGKAAYNKDVENTIKEAADVCIAIFGLRRFDLNKYKEFETAILVLYLLVGNSRMDKAIKEKFDTLKKHRYVIMNGVYRHVELN